MSDAHGCITTGLQNKRQSLDTQVPFWMELIMSATKRVIPHPKGRKDRKVVTLIRRFMLFQVPAYGSGSGP